MAAAVAEVAAEEWCCSSSSGVSAARLLMLLDVFRGCLGAAMARGREQAMKQSLCTRWTGKNKRSGSLLAARQRQNLQCLMSCALLAHVDARIKLNQLRHLPSAHVFHLFTAQARVSVQVLAPPRNSQHASLRRAPAQILHCCIPSYSCDSLLPQPIELQQ